MFLRVLVVSAFIVTAFCGKAAAQVEIQLPEPDKKGKMTVEEAIQDRRSVRTFSDEALTMQDVSQVLWAAGGKTVDGITGPTRSYPSAGGLYPLEIYLVAGNVTGLEPGIYRYDWMKNSLIPVRPGDHRERLAAASWGQEMIKKAPVTLVITVRAQQVFKRYGQRGVSRYVSMDAGHLGENVHLVAQGMGLGTVMVGAFKDKEVGMILNLRGEDPVYIMPVGHPAE